MRDHLAPDFLTAELPAHLGLRPLRRLNRRTGAFDVVPSLFESPEHPGRLFVQTPGGLVTVSRVCPHQGADLKLTGDLVDGGTAILCRRHPAEGPFPIEDLDARPLQELDGPRP